MSGTMFNSRPEADRPTQGGTQRVRSDKRQAMTINLKMPDIRELKPRITVFGVGGAGGNAVNNMITAGLVGCEFVVANTDAQALTLSKAERIIQMGLQVTEGLGAGSQPDVGRAAAEEVIDEIRDHLPAPTWCSSPPAWAAAPAPARRRSSRKPPRSSASSPSASSPSRSTSRACAACGSPKHGITELQKAVDTLLIIPNQNLFRVANEKTTFADAFAMADQVLYSGVACITDLMVKEGLINLDFADVRAVMREMGKAMMGTGEASGEKRALSAAEAAISNPLIDETSMKGAKGLLISITGGKDLTLYEVDEAATRIREEVDRRRQHHRRRDVRREPRRHRARVGGGDWHRYRALGASADRRARSTQAMRADARAAGGRGSLAACRTDAEPARLDAAHGGARTHRSGPPRGRAGALDRAGGRRPSSRTPRSRRGRAPAPAQITAIEDVTIRPITPKPTLFRESAETRRGVGAARPRPRSRSFRRRRSGRRCARRACRASMNCRCRRKTRSAPAQAETAAAPEKPRQSLLQRLASVGLGRREEETRARRRRPRSDGPPMPKAPPMPPLRPAARAAARIGVGLCQTSRRPASGPARARPAWPAGACA